MGQVGGFATEKKSVRCKPNCNWLTHKVPLALRHRLATVLPHNLFTFSPWILPFGHAVCQAFFPVTARFLGGFVSFFRGAEREGNRGDGSPRQSADWLAMTRCGGGRTGAGREKSLCTGVQRLFSLCTSHPTADGGGVRLQRTRERHSDSQRLRHLRWCKHYLRLHTKYKYQPAYIRHS